MNIIVNMNMIILYNLNCNQNLHFIVSLYANN